MAENLPSVWLALSTRSTSTKVNHDAGGGIGTEIADARARTFPPLTLLYCAALLERHGLDLKIMDGNILATHPLDLLGSGVVDPPDVLVLQTALPTVVADLDRIRTLRAATDRHLRIICVGTFLEPFHEALLDAGADGVLAGDPELCIEEAVINRTAGFLAKRASSSDLEALPHPAWHLIDIGDYTSHTILSSRGCSMGCGYCPYRVYQGDSVHARSAPNVVRELAWLRSEHGADYVLFRDPLFTFDQRRVHRIVEGIVAVVPEMDWACETRFELLSEPLIASMGKAGCHHVRLGIETVRPETLVQAGRIPSAERAEGHLDRATKVIGQLRDHGIKSVCFFMLGFADDDVDSASAIADFVERADPDVALLNYATPYPGTSFADEARANGFITEPDLAAYGSKARPVVRTRHLDADELHAVGEDLIQQLTSRNRQFYPIR